MIRMKHSVLAAVALSACGIASAASAQTSLIPQLNGGPAGEVARPRERAPEARVTAWRLLDDRSRAYVGDNNEVHALYVFCNGGRHHIGYAGLVSGGFIDAAEAYEAQRPSGAAFLFDQTEGVILEVFSSRHQRLAMITLTPRRVTGGTVFRATLSDNDVDALRAAYYISWTVGTEQREWRGDGSTRAIDGIRPHDGRAC